MKPEVKPGRAYVNAGRKRHVSHRIGPVLYPGAQRAAPTTVRNKHPHPGPSQTTSPAAIPHGNDDIGIPTIAGCDDPILSESPSRYRIPIFGIALAILGV
jgi:hypothetical protein